LDVYHAPELHPDHLGISIGSLYYLAWIVALRGDYFGSIRRRPKMDRRSLRENFLSVFVSRVLAGSKRAFSITSS